MIAAPRFPVARKEPALRRFLRTLYRRWLLWEMGSTRNAICMYDRYIANELAVIKHYPEHKQAATGELIAYREARQAEVNYLSALQIRLIEHDRKK